MTAPQYNHNKVLLEDVRDVLSNFGKQDQAEAVYESLTTEEFSRITDTPEEDEQTANDFIRENLHDLLREKGII